MFKKLSALLVIFSVLFFFNTAMAQHEDAPPYKNGGNTVNTEGWGEDCSDWVKYEGGFEWDVIYDDDFNDYRKCNQDQQVVWPALTIDVYVEYSTRIRWENQNVYVHRYDDHIDGGKSYSIVFSGWIQSNQANYVQITPSGTWDLFKLDYKNGIPGVPEGGPDIGITWHTRTGDGLTWDDPEDDTGWNTVAQGDPIRVITQLCDHWFQFKATFTLDKHLNEGHYAWEGTACPVPNM